MGERSRKFLCGLGSGYILIATNTVYTLVSIPLALHFLGTKEFGLWALVTQLASYMNLMDMGMQSSTARIFINYKDSKLDGRYGSLVKTSFLIFLAQGLLVLLAGLPLIPFVGHFLGFSFDELNNFEVLLGFQVLILAVGFATRTFGSLLYAHQQYSWSNLGGACGLLLSLFVLWQALASNWGVFSLLFASASSALLCTSVQIIGCVFLDLLPRKNSRGRICWRQARELLSFAKDTFLMSLGWQLISATPTVLISKLLGLEAVAAWAVGTKLLTLCQQVIWKVYDFSLGAFSEMYFRAEYHRLRVRFFEITSLTTLLSVFFGAILILFNSSFVHLWTSGKIFWPSSYDILLGLLLVSYSVNRCHGGFVSVTMKIGFARYIYFLDGALFCIINALLIPLYGFGTCIYSALILDLFLPGIYGFWRSKQFFGTSTYEVVKATLTPVRYYLMLTILLCATFKLLLQNPISWVELISKAGMFVSSLAVGFCCFQKFLLQSPFSRFSSLISPKARD